MRITLRQFVAGGLLASLFGGFNATADAQVVRRRVQTIAPSPQPVVIQTQAVQAGQPVAPATQTNLNRLSFFLNTPIHLQGGATAGQVTDFVFNNNGSVAYVVVTNNGRQMLIPYSAAEFNWDRRFIGVNMQQARFNQIPTFTDWSTVAVQSPFMNQVNSFFGVNPATGVSTTGVNLQSGVQQVPGSTPTQSVPGTTANQTNPATGIPGQPNVANPVPGQPNVANPVPGQSNPGTPLPEQPSSDLPIPKAPATTDPASGRPNPAVNTIPGGPVNPGSNTRSVTPPPTGPLAPPPLPTLPTLPGNPPNPTPGAPGNLGPTPGLPTPPAIPGTTTPR